MTRAGRVLLLLLTPAVLMACAGPKPTSIAGSNEVFGSVDPESAGTPGADDRWAAITLDARQRREVEDILEDMVERPVPPLRSAPYGVRFEDVPRAMINAAPKVEMAVLRGGFLPGEVRAKYRDSLGRAAIAKIIIRKQGSIASVAYDVPGSDAADARAEVTIAIQRVIDASPNRMDSQRAGGILTKEIALARGTQESIQVVPDRYRYTMLMIDGQEAIIEIRREPPPEIVSWTVSAGIFGDDDRGASLGRALEEALKAWGRIPD